MGDVDGGIAFDLAALIYWCRLSDVSAVANDRLCIVPRISVSCKGYFHEDQYANKSASLQINIKRRCKTASGQFFRWCNMLRGDIFHTCTLASNQMLVDYHVFRTRSIFINPVSKRERTADPLRDDQGLDPVSAEDATFLATTVTGLARDMLIVALYV